MPLLPTTIRSAFFSSATSRIASAGSPCREYVSTCTPASLICSPALRSVALPSRLFDLLAGVAQRRLHVLALVDHPLHVVGRLLALLAKALVAHRLECAHQVDARADGPGELGRLSHGRTCGL